VGVAWVLFSDGTCRYSVPARTGTFYHVAGTDIEMCKTFNLKKTLHDSSTVAQIAYRFELNTVLWAFDTIQPSSFFSSSLYSWTNSDSNFVRLPLQTYCIHVSEFCDSSCGSSIAATWSLFRVLFRVILRATNKFHVVLWPLASDPGDATECCRETARRYV